MNHSMSSEILENGPDGNKRRDVKQQTMRWKSMHLCQS